MSKLIEIKHYSDSIDCDTCGYSVASGAEIFIDGKQLVDIVPNAHCYNSLSYNMSDIFYTILKELGYEIKIDYIDDDEYDDENNISPYEYKYQKLKNKF